MLTDSPILESPDATSLGWAVVTTRHACEELAEKRLRQVGYRVYLPRVRRVLTGHTRQGWGKPVLRPMLPGYLFAELHPGQWIMPEPGRWKHWRTPWDKARAFVSDAAIDLLRCSEADEGEQAEAAATHRSAVGDFVQAERHGTAIAGIVTQLRGTDRLIVQTLAGATVELRQRDIAPSVAIHA